MKQPPKQPDYPIHTRPALRALAAATRQEIVDALAGAGPLPVAALARLLGRRPDALYFHVRVLLRAGLLIERHPRDSARRNSRSRTRGDSPTTPPAVGRHPAAVYDLPGRPVRLDYEAAPRPALARIVQSAIRLAQREFQRECLSGRPAGRGPSRTLWGGRVMGWINAADLKRVNTLIAELHEVLRRGRPGRNRRAMSLGFLLAPAGFGDRVRSSRANRTKSARSHRISEPAAPSGAVRPAYRKSRND